jgi:hypothetical protein
VACWRTPVAEAVRRCESLRESLMNGSHAERMQGLWIVQNPWLRNAFRKQVEPAAASVVASPGPSGVDAAFAPCTATDVDVVSRVLSEIDEQQIARVCAEVERHLKLEQVDDPAGLRRATAVGLAIGCSLRHF